MAVKLSEQDRQDLIKNLKRNRCEQESGSGDFYWETVVDIFEGFLTYVAERRAKKL